MADIDKQRIAAATYCVDQIQDGMLVGLGTGRAATHFVKLLAERVRNGLQISGMPTSHATEALAKELGIPLVGFSDTTRLDVVVDGADEVAPGLALIKGGGGALLHEKIVASISERMLVVAEDPKLVRLLGRFPLPVEVIPFGWEAVEARLTALGGNPVRRVKDDGIFLTDEGNYILDCHFGQIEDPIALAQTLKSMVGVVEHGLFIGIATEAVIGREDGVLVLTRESPVEQWP
jgi:ribose 5-phosphate isomerase A